MKDWISGEEVNYQYDLLGRLTSAVTTGPEWGNGFVYDGFGNLLQKNVTKGSAPALSIQVDGATNRRVGVSYDANGNEGSGPYDVENRLLQIRSGTTWNGTYDNYTYGADNRRMGQRRRVYVEGSVEADTTEATFYGAGGEMLGAYEVKVVTDDDGIRTGYFGWPGKTKVWLGGRLLKDGTAWVWQDRLGSVVKRGSTTYKYFAWGEERTIGQTLTGKEQFGTYLRSDLNGLDYAVNRWYSNTQGRFTTADPYQASGGAADPGSWNRYLYVQGDPVNYYDPLGLFMALPISNGPTIGGQVSGDPGTSQPGPGGDTVSMEVTRSSGDLEASVSGGGDEPIPIDTKLNEDLSALLGDALRSLSSDCVRALRAPRVGITKAQLAKHGANVQFYDATNLAYGGMAISAFVGGSSTQTLGNFSRLQGGTADTLVGSTGIVSHSILVGHSFRSASLKEQRVFLMRELIRISGEWNYVNMAGMLGLESATEEKAKGAITEFLKNDCKR
jgi:RHS repeat-associated protein